MSIQDNAFQVIRDIRLCADTAEFDNVFVEDAVECLFLQGDAAAQAAILEALVAAPEWHNLLKVVWNKFSRETHSWLARQVQTQLECAQEDAALNAANPHNNLSLVVYKRLSHPARRAYRRRLECARRAYNTALNK
jgi:hypothetical protein